MASNLIFQDCNISFLKIESNTPLEITSTDNNNIINQITLSPTGDNLDKNLIIVNGDFSNSSIDVQSSCTFQSNPTFICNTPIKIDTNLSDTIVLLGNFFLSSGINVVSPTKIVSGTNIQLENLNLIIAYNKDNQAGLNIVGDFSHCTMFIQSSSNINLNGVIGQTIVEANVTNVSLNLAPESTVNDMKALSKILVSGDEASVNNVVANTSEGLDNVEVLYNTFIMDALNGQGKIQFKLSSTGKYQISCFVVDDVTDIPIGSPVTIEIK